MLALLIIIGGLTLFFNKNNQFGDKKAVRLYWFIPDGVRAEPDLFTMFKWAEEGKLPNIKKMMKNGSYGYVRPTFPSHTPTNFASLLTGTYPEIHGVDDGPMRVIGKPLDKVAVGGFRSVAKKVEPIWVTLEKAGYKVGLVSMPGSTPPEIDNGVVLRGRWGGWGADFHALNFESQGDMERRVKQGRGSRLFFFGPQLTNYIETSNAEGWENVPQSFSIAKEVDMVGWGAHVFGYIYDSTDDGQVNYDRVAFSLDKKQLLADISQGEWSDWASIVLSWKSKDTEVKIDTYFKARVIKLDDDGFFRVRLFYDNLNEYVTQPIEVSKVIHEAVGPMTDFVDNFPPQLIYYDEDKDTFLSEAWMTFNWHKKIVKGLVDSYSPDIVLHDIYSPNQMLTSRWWMGYVDPNSARYDQVSEPEREQLWQEVLEMYKKLDEIVGEILAVSSEDSYIVFSSDHGAVPLDKWVHLNNLFADKGWLKLTINPETGEPVIDWEKSKVIYLKMAHVYINPEGLDGDYYRSTGLEYKNLRQEVKQVLLDLEDTATGVKPVIEATEWEKAKEFMKLDPERIGDLVITNEAGYGWNEEMSQDLNVFSEPLKTGYKQAIKAEDHSGMWAPFIMMGPGIKKNFFLGDKPIEMVDQYPTIMKAIGEEAPEFVQGKSLPIFIDGL